MAGPHNPSSADSAPLTFSILRRYALAFLFLALISAVAGFEVARLKAVWAGLKIGNLTADTGTAGLSQPTVDAVNAEFAELTRMTPQQQAEQLLALAIRRHQGSLDLIGQNAESWHGHLQNTDRLFDLVLTAMKSTPLNPASTIRVTAFVPPPPTPTTLITARYLSYVISSDSST